MRVVIHEFLESITFSIIYVVCFVYMSSIHVSPEPVGAYQVPVLFVTCGGMCVSVCLYVIMHISVLACVCMCACVKTCIYMPSVSFHEYI